MAGCGSQNLGPLEEKTTKLRDDNHKLKSNIQELKQNISKENQKIASLNKDKKNMKQAKENKKKATNLKASSTYYKNVAKRIDDYNQIDDDVTKNKGNKDIESKLTDINNLEYCSSIYGYHLLVWLFFLLTVLSFDCHNQPINMLHL